MTHETHPIGTGERPIPAIEATTVKGDGLVEFQSGVDAWMDACFGAEIKADVTERCDRFLEEALEFVQAAGYSADRAHALVDYTFGRPQGEINQEVGGVMVTLAAMCNTLSVNIGQCAETELARVWTKIDAIRAKQAAKPTGSALPIATPEAADTITTLKGEIERVEHIVTAWAFAHDINGAARNDLFARLRQALSQGTDNVG